MEKNKRNTHKWAPVIMTASLLWVSGAGGHKVYFDCGAVVDVVDEQGLVLSPGFPYNYSSGTHCVWQFFVPVGYRLTMEVFDFDVFESPGSTGEFRPTSEAIEEENANDETTPSLRGMVVTPNGLPRQTQVSATKTSWGSSERLPPLPSKTEEVRQVVVQEESTKMEMAKVSNSAKRSTDLHPGVKPQSRQAGTRAENSVSPDTYRGDANPDESLFPRRPAYEENATSVPETSTGAAETGAETRPSSAEACPHDVLYISDLTTFSSRFCGSNKPTGRRLAFGSSREMVEVIMELITTTHWGRGFVLLFQYRNETDEADGHFRKPTASRTDALLAATSGAAFFLVILTGALCIIFRPKICLKGANACSSNSPELQVGVQHSGGDLSELQLVSQPCMDVIADGDNSNQSPSPTHTGLSSSGGADTSHNAELELSSNGLIELELGADEVFVIASGPAPTALHFSPVMQQEKALRRSETSPGPVCAAQPAEAASSPGKESSSAAAAAARPRAWSVRAFHDLLPPLPQLHRKWCSWNSTSPFTKLLDGGSAGRAPAAATSETECHRGREGKVLSEAHLENRAGRNLSDSSVSSASCPLSQPLQKQRRLSSTSTLRRARFASPCFGLLAGPSESSRGPAGPLIPYAQPQNSLTEMASGSSGPPLQADAQAKLRDFPSEEDHTSVPVFAISEEEDRQPLVLTESSPLNEEDQDPYSNTARDHRSPPTPCNQDPVSGSSCQRKVPDWYPWGNHSPVASCGSLTPSEMQAMEAGEADVHCTFSTAIQMPPCSFSQPASATLRGMPSEQI
ncbi:uncharacterized protein [Lepisosteus oculatus]|nr:PREDICTED: uncharacterized protein LOC107079698 isoform X3 [Lepisosteus oculatus]